MGRKGGFIKMSKNGPKVENVLGLVFDKDENSEIKEVSEVSTNKLPISKGESVKDKILKVKNPGKVVKKSNIRENKELMKKGLRRCKECGEIKELKWFGKKDKNRWLTVCRSCTSIYSENRVLFDEGLRRCKECKRVLPLLQFNIKSVDRVSGKAYRFMVCKDCLAEFEYSNAEKWEVMEGSGITEWD